MNIYRLARLAKKITDDQESEHLIEYENQQFELIVPITPAGFRRLQKGKAHLFPLNFAT